MNELAINQPEPMTSSLAILQAAIAGGVTSENVSVVKEIIAMRRDEMALESKRDFNRAFFALKKEIASLDIYCDREAKTKGGDVAYTYCSESEITKKLEPLLFKHGFAMLFGQRKDADSVTAIITLIHESGHEEPREYSVRTGVVNAMKDATSVDAGSTTSAWRHLVIKMFGLKSRIREQDDAHNIGATISASKASELFDRVHVVGADPAKFLAFAKADSFETIGEAILPQLEKLLAQKESAKKPDTSLAKEELFK